MELAQQLRGVKERQKQSALAITYHQLGRVAEELREYEEARLHYQKALDLKIKYGDRYSCAKTYHNLGTVAQELREYEEARRNYKLALDIKIEYGDRFSSANTYHQLGMVAQKLREYAEARLKGLPNK